MPDLLEQYGCGAVRFPGDSDALHERHLLFDDVVAPATAGPRDRFEAAARSIRDVLSQRWVLTESTYARENPDQVYYISMEFQIGRSLADNISNLLIDRATGPPLPGLARRGARCRSRQWRAGAVGGMLSRLHGDDAAAGHGL